MEEKLDKTYIKHFPNHNNQILGSPSFFRLFFELHYSVINLNAFKKTECLLLAKEKHCQSVIATIMKFIAKLKPLHEFLFNAIIVNDIEPTDWWKSQTTWNNEESVLRMT